MIGTLPSCHASSKNVTVFDQVTGLAMVLSFRGFASFVAHSPSPKSSARSSAND
jgi:hypothetical protein